MDLNRAGLYGTPPADCCTGTASFPSDMKSAAAPASGAAADRRGRGRAEPLKDLCGLQAHQPGNQVVQADQAGETALPVTDQGQ